MQTVRKITGIYHDAIFACFIFVERDLDWSADSLLQNSTIVSDYNSVKNENFKSIAYQVVAKTTTARGEKNISIENISVGQDHNYGVPYMELKNDLKNNDAGNIASFLSSPSSSSSKPGPCIKATKHIRVSNSRWLRENEDNHRASGYRCEGECDEDDQDDELSDTNVSDITRCICEMSHDDGFMICCDRCQ